MRCYNGAPDSQLQAVLDANKTAGDELRAMGLWPTYFPDEGQWLVFDGYREVPGVGFQPTMRDLLAAVRRTKET